MVKRAQGAVPVAPAMLAQVASQARNLLGIDLKDSTSYNNATSMTVYDAKGQDIALTYYFQKAATDTW